MILNKMRIDFFLFLVIIIGFFGFLGVFMERDLWLALKDVLNGQSLKPNDIPRRWLDHPEKFSASMDWQAIVAIEGMMTLLKKPQESSEKRTLSSDGSDGFQDVKTYFEALDPEIQKAVLGALKFAQNKANSKHEPIPQSVSYNIGCLLDAIKTPDSEWTLLTFQKLFTR